MRGQLACCFVLLDAGASPRALDEERRCAMHMAMQYSGGFGSCSESTLLLLRLLQLDPSLVRAVDADKRTPLHWASGKNALPCVKALLTSGAEFDAQDWAGRTPLHWAVLVDAVETAEQLLTVGANPRHADRDRRTPLHWAADRASEGCLRLLLQSIGTEDGSGATIIDSADWGGYTALHYAARCAAARATPPRPAESASHGRRDGWRLPALPVRPAAKSGPPATKSAVHRIWRRTNSPLLALLAGGGLLAVCACCSRTARTGEWCPWTASSRQI